jgi:hypothetical protein
MDSGNIYALVVGIDEYEDNKKWASLKKAAAGARSFVKWLVDSKEVLPENITLFTSEGNDQHDNFPDITQGKADRDSIEQWIIDNVIDYPSSDGDLLYVFWNGHGFLNRESQLDTRRLVLADATVGKPRNLNLTSLIIYL